MTYAFLDDHANENEKLVEIGGGAAWYWACGLMYCRRREAQRHAKGLRVDVIPKAASLGLYSDPLAAEHVKAIVRVGLWKEFDAKTYIVHDYHEFHGQGPRCAPPALRRSVIERDGLQCALCGHEVAIDDVAIDHALPWSKGGPTLAWNLRVTHSLCNARRGAAS